MDMKKEYKKFLRKEYKNLEKKLIKAWFGERYQQFIITKKEQCNSALDRALGTIDFILLINKDINSTDLYIMYNNFYDKIEKLKGVLK